MIEHPLAAAFAAALEQVTAGKGERHGGAAVPFYDQQWRTLAECHGVGFLTGQAAKKLNEAGGKDSDAQAREILGAIAYAGMAWLKLNGYPGLLVPPGVNSADLEGGPVVGPNPGLAPIRINQSQESGTAAFWRETARLAQERVRQLERAAGVASASEARPFGLLLVNSVAASSAPTWDIYGFGIKASGDGYEMSLLGQRQRQDLKVRLSRHMAEAVADKIKAELRVSRDGAAGPDA